MIFNRIGVSRICLFAGKLNFTHVSFLVSVIWSRMIRICVFACIYSGRLSEAPNLSGCMIVPGCSRRGSKFDRSNCEYVLG